MNQTVTLNRSHWFVKFAESFFAATAVVSLLTILLSLLPENLLISFEHDKSDTIPVMVTNRDKKSMTWNIILEKNALQLHLQKLK